MASDSEHRRICGSVAPIDDNVDVGGYLAAADPALVGRRGYTHILKLFRDDPKYAGGYHRHPGVEYLVVDADDDPRFPLAQHFAECLRFIQEAIRGRGRILVHCHAGVSRSVTIVLLHLMINKGQGLAAAWQTVKGRRPVAAPNPGFWALLEDIEARATRFRAEGRAPAQPHLAALAPGRPLQISVLAAAAEPKS